MYCTVAPHVFAEGFQLKLFIGIGRYGGGESIPAPHTSDIF